MALNTVTAQGEKVLRSGRSLPRSLKLNVLANRIGGRAMVVDEPPAQLDTLKAYFINAVSRNALAAVPPRMWDNLPAALWYGTAPHLGDMPEILSGIEQHLAKRHAHRCIRGLIGCYFRCFQPANAYFDKCAELLRNCLHARPTAFKRWVVYDDRYSLFKPGQAPAALAEYCLTSRQAFRQALDAIGLRSPLLANRFGLAALYAALDWFENNLSTVGVPEHPAMKLKEWLAERNSAAPLEIESQIRIALALLAPWQHTEPSADLRKYLVDLLLEFVGDPRRGDPVWRLPETQAVKSRLLSWLAYGTIEQFFEIIDASAKAGHWNDRRAFWASYAEKGAITDAWVAFGPVAKALARRVRHSSTLQYGELNGARLRNHSALLLRIGSLVVADYSHDGSCRFYDMNDRQPEFYASSYDDDRLRWDASNTITHQGNWQWRFAYYIRQQTGIRSIYEGRW